MKILIDQNISFRLIQKIEATFPDITHVKYCNLMDANDFEIFVYAKNNQFKAILTLDEDFDNILLLLLLLFPYFLLSFFHFRWILPSPLRCFLIGKPFDSLS